MGNQVVSLFELHVHAQRDCPQAAGPKQVDKQFIAQYSLHIRVGGFDDSLLFEAGCHVA